MQQQYSSDEPMRAQKSTENSTETGTTSVQSKNVLKIDNRYVLDRKINAGAFGKVYKGILFYEIWRIFDSDYFQEMYDIY